MTYFQTHSEFKAIASAIIQERIRTLNYRTYSLYQVFEKFTDSHLDDPNFVVSRSNALIWGLVRSIFWDSAGYCNSAGLSKRRELAAIKKIIGQGDVLLEELALFPVEVTFAPITDSTDERMFLRLLQASEVAFHAAASVLDYGRKKNTLGSNVMSLKYASDFLDVASECSRMTMTLVDPRGFAKFTEKTGNISAIESENYALIEAEITTPTEERLNSALFARNPRAAELARSGNTLAVRISNKNAPSDEIDALLRAQKALQKWKSIHRAAVTNALSSKGVAPEVFTYLKKFSVTFHASRDFEDGKEGA